MPILAADTFNAQGPMTVMHRGLANWQYPKITACRN